MGWFKKTKPPGEHRKDWPKQYIHTLYEEHKRLCGVLNAFRKRGEKFNYLGIEMLVVDFQTRIGDKSYPAIVAEYVDGNGVIRQTQFHPNMLPILEAENPEAVE